METDRSNLLTRKLAVRLIDARAPFLRQYTIVVMILLTVATAAGFNFSAFKPTDILVPNGGQNHGYHTWRELDSAAGFAYLLVVSATAKHGSLVGAQQKEPELIDATVQCLTWLDNLGDRDINPLYEMLLPYGALAAARVNAELGMSFNVTRMIAQSLGDGVNFESYSPWRRGWGMLRDKWGREDVSGIIGSTLGGRPGRGKDPRAGNWDDPGRNVPNLRHTIQTFDRINRDY